MRRDLSIVLVGCAICAACATAPVDDSTSPHPAATEAPSMPLPEGSGFEDPGASTQPKDAGPTPTDAGEASSSSSSSSSSSGSSSSSSSSSGSSSGSTVDAGTSTAGGACGVCDRDWTCNGFTDTWTTQGARCINQRTTTALRCDGEFDQGTSYGVGTWSGDASKITLVYPMLGGGTKSYDCYP